MKLSVVSAYKRFEETHIHLQRKNIYFDTEGFCCALCCVII
jgi:hypothetical protein